MWNKHFTQTDIDVGAHLHNTRHKNIQVVVFLFLLTDVKNIYSLQTCC